MLAMESPSKIRPISGPSFFTSQLIQFSYILLLGNLLGQKIVLQLLSLDYLSVPLIRGDPAPPLTGLQSVVDPTILPGSGFGLLFFLLALVSTHLPAGLAAGSRYHPFTVSGILDELITKELMQTKAMYEKNFQAMEQLIDQWQPKASAAAAQIKKQQERIAMLEEEMEAILMERIRDKANAERYDRMIQKREAEIAAARKQIEELQNIEETLRSRQAKLKRDISMMDDILKEGHLSEAHLRLLVDKIYVHEEDGKLSLDICLKAPFRDHLDIYENGEQTECWVPHSYGFELLDDIIPNNLHKMSE